MDKELQEVYKELQTFEISKKQEDIANSEIPHDVVFETFVLKKIAEQQVKNKQTLELLGNIMQEIEILRETKRILAS
jgi:hypothetical protein